MTDEERTELQRLARNAHAVLLQAEYYLDAMMKIDAGVPTAVKVWGLTGEALELLSSIMHPDDGAE